METPGRDEDDVQILVVEDEDDHAELTRLALRRVVRRTPLRASSLGEAKAILASSGVDLVLLDLGLPESSGLSTLDTMRRHSPTLPIIVLTATDSAELGRAAIELGAQDFVCKADLTPSAITRSIRYSIERHKHLTMQRELIDRLEAQHAELVQAREAAERAQKTQDEFFANMSHELRTPLTSVLGFSDVLAEIDAVRANADISDAVGVIRRNGVHLLGLLNDLLDSAKLASGNIAVESRPFSLQRTVDDLVESFGAHIQGTGVRLAARVDPTVPSVVVSDATRVRQILTNFVSNAVKFTNSGEVLITAEAEPVRPATGDAQGTVPVHRVTVTVKDTGIGMTTEELGRIREFRRFGQADASTTRLYGGSGLGLQIANSLAVLLNGTVRIDSVHGEGTTCVFQFECPAATGAATASVADTASPVRARASALAGQRVLLVEDSNDSRRLLTRFLSSAGAEVTIACDGAEAVAMMRPTTESADNPDNGSLEPEIDLVIMDVQMPILDGIDATAKLREFGVDLPILGLTANATASLRDRCLDAGMDVVLSKPITQHALVEAILEWGPPDRVAA